MKKNLLLITFLVSMTCINGHNLPFNKVVVWGHKLHTHTHSYIHNAFVRTFKALGYNTYWFDNNDNVSSFDFSNSLFITEGQADAYLPVRNDCWYILHNCNGQKYKQLYDIGHAITMQVYTDDVLSRPCKKIETCIYGDAPGKTLYMPWATDLLPQEIDAMKAQVSLKPQSNTLYWVGTIGDGEFGNRTELNPFIRACKQSGITFQHQMHLSVEDNITRIRQSYFAPTIVGEWQKKKGYIPCRIFKNISYGQFGVTNSLRTYEILDKKIVYNSDTYQLFFDAQRKLNSITLPEIYDQMDFVKSKHTYINRINVLLDFLQEVYENSNYIEKNSPKSLGIFTTHDKRLEGLMWGNWGSRPYEYSWVSEIVTITGKKVIDLGCGLPSQYNWYRHVIEQLKPTFYAGIDFDGRIKNEAVQSHNYEIKHMNMAQLEYPAETFDVAFCISTFEHLPHDIFMQAIKEAHRVLKNDGLLVVTLDEQWDKNIPLTSSSNWNTLEQSLQEHHIFDGQNSSFGLPQFLELVKAYFLPLEDLTIDTQSSVIYAKNNHALLYKRENRDQHILHSPEVYNSCVSYAVLKKVN